jgi:hypothetical protein
MIEQGLVALVQDDTNVQAIATAGGGFCASYPPNFQLPTWTYLIVSDVAEYTLMGQSGTGSRRFQIDCYGNTAAEAITLATAINAVLGGYRGTLSDSDNTIIQGCFHINTLDFFDTSLRNFRRSLEYEIWST